MLLVRYVVGRYFVFFLFHKSFIITVISEHRENYRRLCKIAFRRNNNYAVLPNRHILLPNDGFHSNNII